MTTPTRLVYTGLCACILQIYKSCWSSHLRWRRAIRLAHFSQSLQYISATQSGGHHTEVYGCVHPTQKVYRLSVSSPNKGRKYTECLSPREKYHAIFSLVFLWKDGISEMPKMLLLSIAETTHEYKALFLDPQFCYRLSVYFLSSPNVRGWALDRFLPHK